MDADVFGAQFLDARFQLLFAFETLDGVVLVENVEKQQHESDQAKGNPDFHPEYACPCGAAAFGIVFRSQPLIAGFKQFFFVFCHGVIV